MFEVILRLTLIMGPHHSLRHQSLLLGAHLNTKNTLLADAFSSILNAARTVLFVARRYFLLGAPSRTKKLFLRTLSRTNFAYRRC